MLDLQADSTTLRAISLDGKRFNELAYSEKEIRQIVPDHFLLIPGVGAQGGSLEAVCANGMNKDCGLLVNSSRGIIYADSSENFAKIAAIEAEKIQLQMKDQLQKL